MPMPLPPVKRLEKLLHRRPCWLLAELAQALDYALISVRRFLAQAGYFRSYTHNGKWYTRRDAPHFNRDGLWRHQGIGFSKHGSLTATIGQLVRRSPAGLSARELAHTLQHPCQSVLTNLHKDRVLERVKVGGEYRYLAPDAAVNRRQRERAHLTQPPVPSAGLGTQAAVFVLVEAIKHPALSCEQLAAQLHAQRGLAVTPESIRQLFQTHGLKKTPAAPRRKRC